MWFYPVFSTFSEGSLFRLAIVANILYMKIKIASTSSPEVAPSCLGGGGRGGGFVPFQFRRGDLMSQIKYVIPDNDQWPQQIFWVLLTILRSADSLTQTQNFPTFLNKHKKF